MKKFLSLTTSLIATVCALGLGGSALAFAETEDTANGSPYYPTTFETVPQFENLEDYAVGGGKILFLENNKISEYGGESTKHYPDEDNGETGISKTITNIYFEGEEFYYRTDDDKVYALKNFHEATNPDKNPPIEFTSTTETDKITQGSAYYYYDNDVIYVLKDHVDTPLEGFSNLKKYGETVYAVKENVLYTLNGTQPPKEVKVKDLDLTKNIAVGNACDALTASAKPNLQFVSLTGGVMTEVNLDALKENPSTFTVGKTVKVNKTDTAILLYTEKQGAEGISIVAVKGKTYLIHPDNTKLNTVYLPQDLNKDGTATEGYVYSAPIESAGTRIKNSEGQDTVVSGSIKIIKEIKKSDYPVIDGDFYLIEYLDGETTVRGYVRFGLISTFTFNEEPPVATADPAETYEDLVKPVVLILIVLLLIAIAAGVRDAAAIAISNSTI